MTDDALALTASSSHFLFFIYMNSASESRIFCGSNGGGGCSFSGSRGSSAGVWCQISRWRWW